MSRHAIAIAAGLLVASSIVRAADDKPNVIFFKTDDQRFDSLSMTGHPVTRTPNIDRLAAEGVFFRHALITSPICGPSRANTFTGQWERKNRQGFSYVSHYHTTNRRALLDKKTKMARAVTGIDRFVGNLRALLERLGLAENTILVFASDHGLLLGEHGLGGKTFLYEESIRIPMIFYSPRFTDDERGKTVDELVVGQDLPATILELCGLPVPDTYQGRSMVPLIEGRPVEWREDVFCENLFTDQNYPRMEAVRGTEWKYIRYFSRENDRRKYLPEASINGEQPIFEELFNLKDDPKEQHNLAADPNYADVLAAHRKRCQQLVTELAR